MTMRNPARLLVSLALISASAFASAGEPAGHVLKWSSVKEDGLYGYSVYRSENSAGPFLRINARIIPRKTPGTTPDGDPAEHASHYEFVDSGAEPGKSYYYYIEAVADSGRKQRLTGIVRKGPAEVPANQPPKNESGQ